MKKLYTVVKTIRIKDCFENITEETFSCGTQIKLIKVKMPPPPSSNVF